MRPPPGKAQNQAVPPGACKLTRSVIEPEGEMTKGLPPRRARIGGAPRASCWGEVAFAQMPFDGGKETRGDRVRRRPARDATAPALSPGAFPFQPGNIA